MPAGTLALLGTDPTCTVVTEGVEYHCILAHVPAPEVQDWKGTVEPTVDDTSHVNGGCRSLRSDGLEWQCYLGQTAVDGADHRPGIPWRVLVRPRRRLIESSSGLPHATAEAALRTASAISSTGRVPSTGTIPGIRRIHFRWYAA